ncbi:MAG: RNA polymerase sigma factor [Bacteroidales bacterium]|nr:RNA polymerase sigma factor [Bacteroidales bacterium]
MDQSEQELIRLFEIEESRERAFNILVQKYQERLYWHIRKIVISHDDTDDVLQNTFVKIWNNLSSFRKDSQLYTWLYKIATNESLNFLRKRQKERMLSWEEYGNSISETLLDDNQFNGDEIQKKLQKAILTLPEKQRLVFNMKYFDEMKYDEMATILDTSVGALKASYHHAVKKIKTYFEED